MSDDMTSAVEAAKYYNDANVANFYRLCWGGSDIHIGRYDTGEESVADASQSMTRHVLELAEIKPGDRVLDIACGYGGTLRMLSEMGCEAYGLDISNTCVEEALKTNAKGGFEIDVQVGDFHAIESPSQSWDVVICQESIIHSGDRSKVFSEVHRILRPGGRFAFSDILTVEGADIASVQAAFDRLGANAGATSEDYRAMAMQAGFNVLHAEERPADIRRHYEKLAEMLAKPVSGLGADAAGAIAASINLWRATISKGYITWACFVAQKSL